MGDDRRSIKEKATSGINCGTTNWGVRGVIYASCRQHGVGSFYKSDPLGLALQCLLKSRVDLICSKQSRTRRTHEVPNLACSGFIIFMQKEAYSLNGHTACKCSHDCISIN